MNARGPQASEGEDSGSSCSKFLTMVDRIDLISGYVERFRTFVESSELHASKI